MAAKLNVKLDFIVGKMLNCIKTKVGQQISGHIKEIYIDRLFLTRRYDNPIIQFDHNLGQLFLQMIWMTVIMADKNVNSEYWLSGWL